MDRKPPGWEPVTWSSPSVDSQSIQSATFLQWRRGSSSHQVQAGWFVGSRVTHYSFIDKSVKVAYIAPIVAAIETLLTINNVIKSVTVKLAVNVNSFPQSNDRFFGRVEIHFVKVEVFFELAIKSKEK